MTPENLAKMCAEAINRKNLGGLTSKPCITIQMPPSKSEAPRRHLAPGKSPMGDVLSRMEDYDVVAFDAVDVLAWLTAHGIVQYAKAVPATSH